MGKPPKKWKSWKVCPNCGSRATKIFYIGGVNDGKHKCQVCGHMYDGPPREKPETINPIPNELKRQRA